MKSPNQSDISKRVWDERIINEMIRVDKKPRTVHDDITQFLASAEDWGKQRISVLDFLSE